MRRLAEEDIREREGNDAEYAETDCPQAPPFLRSPPLPNESTLKPKTSSPLGVFVAPDPSAGHCLIVAENHCCPHRVAIGGNRRALDLALSVFT
jgi:hypothetical protein